MIDAIALGAFAALVALLIAGVWAIQRRQM